MKIEGKIISGSQIATMTVLQQSDWFIKAGIPNDMLVSGSINIDLSPQKWSILQPDISLTDIEWRPGFVEDFNFVAVSLVYKDKEFPGFIYNPVRTKNSKTMLEVITYQIKELKYGDVINVIVSDHKLKLSPSD